MEGGAILLWRSNQRVSSKSWPTPWCPYPDSEQSCPTVAATASRLLGQLYWCTREPATWSLWCPCRYTTKSLLGALGVAGRYSGEASAAINCEWQPPPGWCACHLSVPASYLAGREGQPSCELSRTELFGPKCDPRHLWGTWQAAGLQAFLTGTCAR